jgi:hypothetical protein
VQECRDSLFVIGDVSPDLLAPERLSRSRPAEQMTVVLMPEAAVYEDNGAVSWKDKIGLAREIIDIQPVTQAGRMQCFAYQLLRSGILSSDSSHVPAARRRIMYVCHTSGGFALPGWFD